MISTSSVSKTASLPRRWTLAVLGTAALPGVGSPLSDGAARRSSSSPRGICVATIATSPPQPADVDPSSPTRQPHLSSAKLFVGFLEELSDPADAHVRR